MVIDRHLSSLHANGKTKPKLATRS